MRGKYWSVIASLTLSSTLGLWAESSAAAVDIDVNAKQVLSEVSKALGAESLKSIEYSGSGYSFALGQAGTVNAPWPKFNDKSFTRVVSFEPWATRLQRVRTQGENPPRGGGGQPLIGEQNQTQVVATGTPAAATLSDELALTLPQAFVKAALAATDASATTESKGGKKYTVVSYTALNQAKTTAWINAQHLIDRVETTIDNVVLGDIKFEATFSDYRNFNGVLFPAHIVQKQAGHPVLDWNVTDVKTNVDVNIQATTQQAAPPASVTSEQLGEGIYLIAGGYAAIAIDFKDHIAIIEGGQNDQRSEAVIAEAKRLFPGKPIKQLVNTHPHFDHLGGARAYVAEGATIVTHKNNEAYLKKIWANPHTLKADKLSANPQKPKFKTVDDKLILTDGDKVVELYHLKNFGHHDGTLVAYLPQQKVLVQADAFNPPATPLTQTPAVINSNHQALAANIERLNLDVQRIIPVHLPADNRKVTLAELHLAIGKQ